MPRHIAIIMDGNGRWAQQRQLSRIKGHKAAIPAVQETVQACVDLKVSCLTLYAFSTENWKRPPAETGTLMALLRQFLRMEMKTVTDYGVRFKPIGDIHELDAGIQKDLRAVEAATQKQTGMTFNLALNYSGRGDIINAFKAAVNAGLPLDSLNENNLSDYMSTAGQPDPDLVIRTSGEMRISNFLLWQIAYSEIWVTDTFWPDFRRKHLEEAIWNYQQRNRRFGGI
ncbi:MAG: di-trans,poly-cis-decaprenylcistransferase [Acidobacteria bacterium]|nr:di-trans,poly-cis-decaprenylcistransferase [Acidobacteriota bacterium]